MFLLGKTLSPYKRVYYALCKYEGIGLPTAIKMCNAVHIHPQCHVNEMNDTHIDKLKTLLHQHLEEQRQAKLARARRERTRIQPILPGSVKK